MRAFLFLAKFAEFYCLKIFETKVSDDLSIWVDECSLCGLYNWKYKDLSMSRDQKVMKLLPPMEKCPMTFYQGVVFTAQI